MKNMIFILQCLLALGVSTALPLRQTTRQPWDYSDFEKPEIFISIDELDKPDKIDHDVRDALGVLESEAIVIADEGGSSLPKYNNGDDKYVKLKLPLKQYVNTLENYDNIWYTERNHLSAPISYVNFKDNKLKFTGTIRNQYVPLIGSKTLDSENKEMPGNYRDFIGDDASSTNSETSRTASIYGAHDSFFARKAAAATYDSDDEDKFHDYSEYDSDDDHYFDDIDNDDSEDYSDDDDSKDYSEDVSFSGDYGGVRYISIVDDEISDDFSDDSLSDYTSSSSDSSYWD